MSRVSACLQDVIQNKMADLSSWFYRGEGNDTLVVGLRGYNLVLLFKKKLRQALNGSHEARNEKKDFKNREKLLDFSRHVFLPLMGGKYVPFGKVVRLSSDFAEKIDRLCEFSRPKHRIHKGIDARIPFAVLVPDLCFLPSDNPLKLSADTLISDMNFTQNAESSKPIFSVEIKPKCGFLPTSSYIKETHSVKHCVCYYCMLQGVKVAQGKYSRQSQYCPVNFLSGDPRRVFHALKSLVSDPQNNLRVFQNGCPIFTHEIVQESQESSSHIKACCPGYVFEKALKESGWQRNVTLKSSHHKCDSLGPYSMGFMLTILEIFIHDSKENVTGHVVDNTQICNGNGSTTFSDEQDALMRVGAFGQGGVLYRLRQVQKMDDMDVEGLYPLYLKAKDFVVSKDAREEWALDGPYTSTLWKEVSNPLKSKVLLDKPLEQWSIKDIILKLCQFSVASTAKDSSVMITLQSSPSKSEQLPFIQTDGLLKEIFVYSINLMDLYPKEFDRVVKYYNDSCTTTQHYLKNIAS